VHSENYFGAGGYDRHVLERVRAQFPVSLHGIGLGLGSAEGLSAAHLLKLKRLVDWIEPELVSSTSPGARRSGGISTICCLCPLPSKRSR
jgi:uncharacterized protein